MIAGRAYDLVRKARQRLPQLGPLTEAAEPSMWMAVPGMYGGVVGGSGQRHRVRPTGFELVEEGFV